MLRRTWIALVVYCAWFGAAPFAAAPTPPLVVKHFPLSKILLDLDDAPLSLVEEIAAEQAKEQWQLDKGPKYKSAPPAQNNNPQTITDEVIFEGNFKARSSLTRLAVFSDDGCDVWINGKLYLKNYARGQHLPDLKQSLHVIPFQPIPNQTYKVKIRYANTIYTGTKDIDGVTLFAFGAAAKAPSVTFKGERVVSAKSEKEGMPGGVMEVVTTIDPADQEATITIKTLKGTGSATFDGTTENSIKVKDGTKIRVKGGTVSSEARNLQLVGTIAGMEAGTWDFTVFRVDPTPYFSDKDKLDVIPEKALAYNGTGVGIDPATGKEGAEIRLRNTFMVVTGLTHLGITIQEANNTIVVKPAFYLRWQVNPEGISESDFNDTGKFGKGFYDSRFVSDRTYKNKLLLQNSLPSKYDSQDFDDNTGTAYRDNIANADLKDDKHLYLHVIDLAARTVEQDYYAAGDLFAYRFVAREAMTYKGVQSSPQQLWHVRVEGTVRLKQVGGVNTRVLDVPEGGAIVGTGAIELTPDGKAPAEPPTITMVKMPPGAKLVADPTKILKFDVDLDGQRFIGQGILMRP